MRGIAILAAKLVGSRRQVRQHNMSGIADRYQPCSSFQKLDENVASKRTGTHCTYANPATAIAVAIDGILSQHFLSHADALRSPLKPGVNVQQRSTRCVFAPPWRPNDVNVS
jgi:hypothetical protein